MDRDLRRHAVRAALPLSFAAFPFGLVYGVAVVDSSVGTVVGTSASWVILAGAAQLSLLSLIDDGAPWPVAVGTALVINARFALYSTALAPAFAAFGRRWRLTLPYLLTDQAASLAMLHFDEEDDPLRRRQWFTVAALTFATGWWIGTLLGVAAGTSLPAGLELEFAVPVMFIAVLVPMVTDRPAVVVATVSAATTIATAGLPNGLNVLVGALAALVVGRVLITWGRPR
ncbi:MAG: AzlC family ABC transporter permease [Acidimicrobiales bacterium]|nr:AzlC family ABC transporter permease [Acidimicrobiales bacterium]